MDLGAAARAAGDHEAALDRFARAARTFPGEARPRMEQAASLRALSRDAEAEGVLVAVLADHPGHPQALMALGHLARARGNHAAALEHFSAAAAILPARDPWPRFERAACLRLLGRTEEAEAAHRAVLADHPDHFQSLMGLGHLARARRDHAGALEHFTAAAAVAPPKDPLPRLEQAASLVALSREAEAESLLSAVLDDHPGHPRALMSLGHLARRRGDTAEALERFGAAAAASPPHDPWPRFERAACLRLLGRTEEAEAAYRAVLADHPGHFQSLMGLGHLARSRGDEAAALERFTAAATAAPPHDPWPRLERAASLRALSRGPEAETLLTAILDEHPGHGPTLMALGQIARARGDAAGALEHFTAAAAASPSPEPWPRFEQANCLRQLGKTAEAEAAYRAVLADHPGHFQSRMGLGHLARTRGDHADALEHFTAAAAAAPPRDPWPRQEQAACLRLLGRLEAAETAYESLLRDHPWHPPALMGLGQLAQARDDHTAALKHFTAAAAAAPATDPWPAFERAASLRRLGRFEDAEAAYRALLDAHPDHHQSLVGMGQLARDRGRRREAGEWFARATERVPEAAGPWLELATERREAGDYAGARDIAEKLLDRDPELIDAWTSLARTERSAGRHDVALRLFETARDLGGAATAQPTVEMATEARALGDPAAAIALLFEALRIEPDNYQTLCRLGGMAKDAFHIDQALGFYRRAIAVKPRQPWAYRGAARCLSDKGERAAAMALLDTAAAACPPGPDIAIGRIELLTDWGEWRAARDLARETFQASPDHFEAWIQGFRLSRLIGTPAELATWLASAPAATREQIARLDHCRGQAAELAGRFQEAIAFYDRSHSACPERGEVLFDLARARILTLDLDAARRDLGRLSALEASTKVLQGRSSNISQTHLGQLLDEHLLDREAVDALRAAVSHPEPARRVALLSRLVARFPDHTPTAIHWLIALRRAGGLDPGSSGPVGAPPAIPQVIVQYWDAADPPADVAALMDGWRAAHPAFRYERFHAGLARDFLARVHAPEVVMAYERASEPAQKADLFRLAYLYAEGGYYIDADDRCLGPLDTVAPVSARLVLYQEDYGTVGNNIIAVAPQHPVIGRALDQATESINRGDRDILWFSTGPGLLTRALARTVVDSRLSQAAWLATVCVLHRVTMQRAVAMHCRVAYKQTDKHWSRTAFGRRGGALAVERDATA